jgi:hypothetical protein
MFQPMVLKDKARALLVLKNELAAGLLPMSRHTLLSNAVR